jgi:ABC-2 type transport system permease protein
VTTFRIRRVAAVVLRQLYLMRGSFTRVVPTFIWVGIDMVLWGFMTRYLNQVARPGLDFVPTLLGAVLLWDFFARVMHGVTTAFFEDIWSRNFLNVFATPIGVLEYVAGLVLTSIATSILGLVVMVALASGCFGLSFLAYGVLIVPFALVLFLFGIALGVLGCAIVLHLGPASEWFIWPIPAIVSPFAGVFYPVATLPSWMQAIAHALPPSSVFEALRSIVAGGHPPLLPLLESTALAFVYVVLACLLFAGVHRRAVRTGLLARYSAESVN